MFLDRAARYSQKMALSAKNLQSGRYESISWNDWKDAVVSTALGLYALGIRHGGHVGILSENRPEWTFADLATLSLGASVVPVYPTCTLEDTAYILNHAEVEVLFVSNSEQLAKALQLKDGCGSLRKIVCFDDFCTQSAQTVSLKFLMEKGRKTGLNNPDLFFQCIEQVQSEDVATLIYTSGTTGRPKGVMLTHRNFIENYSAARSVVPLSENDVALSFLPLSHVFERLAGYYFMMAHGAQIAYAENMKTVAEDIQIVRPTVAAAVPRFYEKVYARIHEVVQNGPPIRRALFEWAINAGGRYKSAELKRLNIPFGLKVSYWLASLLVLQKIKRKMGGRIRFFISGGAPLPRYLADFFYAAGVLILEGYGLTETSPVIAVNDAHDFKFGSVGRPLSNALVKISEDGEILTQGPCVMKGYYKNEEQTHEVIRDGWFYTGDIGLIDEEGFLHITDRKKDLIVTSGGKNVAPQNIENILTQSELLEQVVMIGDKRNYIVALIVLNQEEALKRARQEKLVFSSWEDLIASASAAGWVQTILDQKMEGLASYERIKYFSILPKELTQESGELTPTLKVKRRVVMERYKDVIDRLYTDGEKNRSV